MTWGMVGVRRLGGAKDERVRTTDWGQALYENCWQTRIASLAKYLFVLLCVVWGYGAAAPESGQRSPREFQVCIHGRWVHVASSNFHLRR